MKVVCIINNKNNRLSGLLPQLERMSRDPALGSVHLLTTLWAGHAVELARQATQDMCDYLVAVGGDGTLHEVVNGMMQSNIPTNAHPALGLLPYGSANDFARTTEVAPSLEALILNIRNRATRRLDLGKIILEPGGETRYFINIAGVGLGAEVVKRMENASGFLDSRMGYFWHILKGFYRYTKKEVLLTEGDWHWKGPLMQLAVANGRYFGNAICVAPEARPDDGKFHLSIFGDLSLKDYLLNLPKLKKGVAIHHPEVHYFEAQMIRLESAHPLGIEADGEYVGQAPATFSILPGAIRFIGSLGRD